MPIVYSPDTADHNQIPDSFLKSKIEPYWSWLAHPANIHVAKEYGYELTPFSIKKKVVKPKGPEKPLAARKNFLFGCDPELFIVDPDGNFVCADMIPGTKENPHGVKFGAVQRDGFAAEINIDPVSNFEDFNRNIKAVLGQLENMLPK